MPSKRDTMKEYRNQPDIIKFKTPIINVGYLKQEQILFDPLISIDKQSNQNVISDGCWVQIENELYYFKVPSTNLDYLKELLGEKVSKYFELSSVHYNLAEATYKKNNTSYHVYGLLSKWARTVSSQYTTLENLINYDCQLKDFPYEDLDLLDIIDSLFPNQPILKEIRFFLVREFISHQIDRQPSEILIETNNDKVNLGYLLDYEREWNSRLTYEYHLPNYFYFNPENKKVLSKIRNDDFMQEALIKAMNINILKILEEIEEEHKIRLINYDKDYFKNEELKVKKYIKDKKMIR
jgi:hypothetical protein